jgi:hypothetical protein
MMTLITGSNSHERRERVSFDQAKKRLLELAKDYDRIAVLKHERKEKRKNEC